MPKVVQATSSYLATAAVLLETTLPRRQQERKPAPLVGKGSESPLLVRSGSCGTGAPMA